MLSSIVARTETAVPILVYSVILRLCRVKNEESVEASWEITGENGGTKA
jgi:hypothetical protein